MKHSLGTINEGIHAIRDLDDEEYRKYKDAATRLWRYANDQQTFILLSYNYFEVRQVLGTYLSRYSKLHSPSPDMGVQINRVLLNLLSSIRTFLDHAEYNLKKRYGPVSAEYIHFKEACAAAYDGDFSYRFIYRLRNYAQHCGLPVGSLQIGSGLDSTGKSVDYLKVCFDRDTLLNSFDSWGKQLESELKNMQQLFEINPHIDSTIQHLDLIHNVMNRDHLSKLLEDAKYIRMILEPTKGQLGTPGIFAYEGNLVKTPGEMVNLTVEWIPSHVLEVLEKSTMKAL